MDALLRPRPHHRVHDEFSSHIIERAARGNDFGSQGEGTRLWRFLAAKVATAFLPNIAKRLWRCPKQLTQLGNRLVLRLAHGLNKGRFKCAAVEKNSGRGFQHFRLRDFVSSGVRLQDRRCVGGSCSAAPTVEIVSFERKASDA